MPSLLGTTVTNNYNRVVGPTYTTTDGVRTYVGPYSNFGTRLLKFYKVESVHDGGAVNFTKGKLDGTGEYTDQSSLLSKAIMGIQQHAELFYVGTPGTAGFLIALADDTADGSEVNSNVQGTGFGAMEATIKSAIGADTSVTVTKLAEHANGLSLV